MVAEIEQIENISELNFIEYQTLFEKIGQQAKDVPEASETLLPKFCALLERKVMPADILLTATGTFAAIIKNISKTKLAEAINDVYTLNKSVIEKGSMLFCMQDSTCSTILFNKFLQEFSQIQFSDDTYDVLVSMANNILVTMLYMPDDELLKAFEIINSFEPQRQKIFFAIYGSLFGYKSVLRESIWEKISTFRVEKTSDFTVLYKNLQSVAVNDVSKVSQCLYIINTSIAHPRQNASSLRAAYTTLGYIRTYNQYKEKADMTIMRGLLHPENSANSKRYGYTQLDKTDNTIARFTMFKRVERTQANMYGLKNVDNVEPSEPALLFLGGNGTVDEKSANIYLTTFERLLHKNNIKDGVTLYAAVYDFDDSDFEAENFYDYTAHVKMMHDDQQAKKIVQELNADTFHAQYVNELFENFFLKRIVDENGKRLSVQQACLNMRKITIVAHCHGAYTFAKLEEKLEEKLTEAWYLPEERLMILHELLCIAHSPYIPLGVAKSTMISFISIQDVEVSQYKYFEYEMQNMSETGGIMLSYFPGQQGEMFLAPNMGDSIDKHKLLDYNPEQVGLNKNGQAILIFASNTIINGVKNSIEGNSLPSVKDVVCGQSDRLRAFFDSLQQNGSKIWSKISAQLQSQNETNQE